MASHTSGSSGSGPAAPQRKALKSQKLDRTLQELESAFSDWESLGNAKNRAPAAAAAQTRTGKAEPAQACEEEFRKKTKKLLSQLREQLAELND
jgi:hypothetical protein